jgi:hypothetical protein
MCFALATAEAEVRVNRAELQHQICTAIFVFAMTDVKTHIVTVCSQLGYESAWPTVCSTEK